MSIEEAPLWRENSQIEKYTRINTPTPTRSPITREKNVMSPSPKISILGGPRISSGVRLAISSVFGSDIRENKEKNSDRDKYICKVQNSKIFHCNKIYHMSDKYSFICMWKGSCKNESIGTIEEARILLVFFMDIVVHKTKDKEHSYDLKCYASQWKGKCYSWIIGELQREEVPEEIYLGCIFIRFQKDSVVILAWAKELWRDSPKRMIRYWESLCFFRYTIIRDKILFKIILWKEIKRDKEEKDDK